MPRIKIKSIPFYRVCIFWQGFSGLFCVSWVLVETYGETAAVLSIFHDYCMNCMASEFCWQPICLGSLLTHWFLHDLSLSIRPVHAVWTTNSKWIHMLNNNSFIKKSVLKYPVTWVTVCVVKIFRYLIKDYSVNFHCRLEISSEYQYWSIFWHV